MRDYSKAARRRGAALVEFALVFPIVMLFIGALLEFSRVSMLRHSADTAAYEGARVGVVVGAKKQAIVGAADSLLASAQLKKWTVTVAPDSINESTPFVRVRVDIPVAENSWVSPFFFTEHTVTSTVTLVTERPTAVQLSGLSEMSGGGGALGVNALGIGL